jgi:hypothetical protein
MRLSFPRLIIAAAAAVVTLATVTVTARAQQGQDDAFVLGWLIALNENEVNAAMVA